MFSGFMNFYCRVCHQCFCVIIIVAVTGSVVSFQGQYFSGGSFRIYLLGNPVVWWSNLAFLAIFLLTYFMAAIKRQRGYDADEDCETKSKSSVGVKVAS